MASPGSQQVVAATGVDARPPHGNSSYFNSSHSIGVSSAQSPGPSDIVEYLDVGDFDPLILKPPSTSPRRRAEASLHRDPTGSPALPSPFNDSLYSTHPSLPTQISSSSLSQMETQHSSTTSLHDASPPRRRRPPALQSASSSQNSRLRPSSHTSPVDLTNTSPADNVRSHAPLKRRRLSEDLGSKKRRKDGQSGSEAEEEPVAIEQIDLQDVEDDSGVSALLKKQREDQIQALRNESREGQPTRISSVQCVICLEPPTNLTSTNCGKCDPRVTSFKETLT
ncbi:MAG: hypothetical protein M4579_001390 [Chaenotheca gracillima]|nr:MAG: hypothetical protein M4579_001390 [Chaenotheca gracillima]